MTTYSFRRFSTKMSVAQKDVTDLSPIDRSVRSGSAWLPSSKPVTDDDGDKIIEVVDEIIWTADRPGIKPGEFDTFVVSAGPLPTDAKSVSFKALQTGRPAGGSACRRRTADGPSPCHPRATRTVDSRRPC
jgi:hypothetical protein